MFSTFYAPALALLSPKRKTSNTALTTTSSVSRSTSADSNPLPDKPKLAEYNYPEPLFIKNTFIHGPVDTDTLLDGFFQERTIHSCPASGIAFEQPGSEEGNVAAPEFLSTPFQSSWYDEAWDHAEQEIYSDQSSLMGVRPGWASEHVRPLPEETIAVTNPVAPSLLSAVRNRGSIILGQVDSQQNSEAMGWVPQADTLIEIPWTQCLTEPPHAGYFMERVQAEHQTSAQFLATQPQPHTTVPSLPVGLVDSTLNSSSHPSAFFEITSSVQVAQAEELCSEPELGSPELPTVGSMAHRLGKCRPCAFVYKNGCNDGVQCKFCHLCRPGEKKLRKQSRVNERKERVLGQSTQTWAMSESRQAARDNGACMAPR